MSYGISASKQGLHNEAQRPCQLHQDTDDSHALLDRQPHCLPHAALRGEHSGCLVCWHRARGTTQGRTLSSVSMGTAGQALQPSHPVLILRCAALRHWPAQRRQAEVAHAVRRPDRRRAYSRVRSSVPGRRAGRAGSWRAGAAGGSRAAVQPRPYRVHLCLLCSCPRVGPCRGVLGTQHCHLCSEQEALRA